MSMKKYLHIQLLFYFLLLMSSCYKNDKENKDFNILKIDKKILKSKVIIRKELNKRLLRPLDLLGSKDGKIIFLYEPSDKKFSARMDVFDENLNLIKNRIKLDFKEKYPSDFFYASLVPVKNGFAVFDWKRKMIINFSKDFRKYLSSFSIKNFVKTTDILPAYGNNIILCNNRGAIIEGKFKRRYEYILFNLKTLKTRILFRGVVHPNPIDDDSFYVLKEDIATTETNFFILDRNNDFMEKYDYNGKLLRKVKIKARKERLTEDDKREVIENKIRLLNIITKRKISYPDIKKKMKFRKYLPLYSYIYGYEKGIIAVRINDLKPIKRNNLRFDIFDNRLKYKGSFIMPKFYNYWDVRLTGGKNNFVLYSKKSDSFYLIGYENFGSENERLFILKIKKG